jgi:hypothetical protein
MTSDRSLRQAAKRAEAMQPEARGVTLGGELAQYRRPNRRGVSGFHRTNIMENRGHADEIRRAMRLR